MANFLEFYTVDLTTIIIILLLSMSVFMLINYFDEKKEDNYKFNVILSIIIGILGSIIYSYATLESDEILTTNYWD